MWVSGLVVGACFEVGWLFVARASAGASGGLGCGGVGVYGWALLWKRYCVEVWEFEGCVWELFEVSLLALCAGVGGGSVMELGAVVMCGNDRSDCLYVVFVL